MRNPFSLVQPLKTKEEKRNILMKAHLNLPIINSDYMPDELVEKRKELEDLMLKYIWKWGNELTEED